MSVNAIRNVPGDLGTHPASLAWNQVSGRSVTPRRIEALHRETYADDRKSVTFRLYDAREDGGSVIAKRARASLAAVERAVYESVLPGASVRTLEYFGSLPEPDGKKCWIFLEDADGAAFSGELQPHRQVAARWLAGLHLHTAGRSATVALPDRGTSRYRLLAAALPERLKTAREAAVLNAVQSETLDDLAPLLVKLSQEWDRIDQACACLPSVLVHGDLVDKNIRLAGGDGPESQLSILVFDWETAGWGTAAVDLASSRVGNDDRSLVMYHDGVSKLWPTLSVESLRTAVRSGRIMQTMMAIDWALFSVGPDCLTRPFSQIPFYTFKLRKLLDLAP